MKDRVFITWSGSNSVAVKVKEVLETRYNYLCYIGGNADNDSSFASIGDTVIQQMKLCNQAIVIFQNREGKTVSNNLFFELGYVLSKYKQPKVHCVKRKNEKIVLPSDFDNSFVEPVDDSSEESFVNGIVDYFIARQKMSISENKMRLINNRYIMHDYINCHYSECGSKCSDYELAQYMLFYMQAAHMFKDEKNVRNEIENFKKSHNNEFSDELSLAVNLALSFFDLTYAIKFNENSVPYIDGEAFTKMKSDYENYISLVKDDDTGNFDEWLNIFIYEQLSYGYLLFAESEEAKEYSDMIYEYAVGYVDKTIDAIKTLELKAPVKENHDDTGILSLIKSYVYRNKFLCSVHLKKVDALVSMQNTYHERSNLKNNFRLGTIDSKLFDNFLMEYYLCKVEYLSYSEQLNISSFEKKLGLTEIERYIKATATQSETSKYIGRIEALYLALKDAESK